MGSKQLRSLLALLLGLALIAAACGGGSDADDTSTGADDSSTGDDAMDDEGDHSDDAMDDEDAMDDGEAVVVTITGPERSEEEAGAISDVLNEFAQAQGFSVEYVGSADWESDINIALEAGTQADIAIFPQPGKLAGFARDGHLQALPDDVAATAGGQWPADWMAFGEVDGVQYGVPNKADLKSIVWYKPGRFEALGYDVPQTWDELKALTEQAINDGNTPWCVGIESGQATGWPFTDWVEDLMLRFNSVDVYDGWVTGEVPFSDERVVSTMQAVKDLWDTPGAVFAVNGTITASHHSDSGVPLVSDDCLMFRQATFFASFLPEGTNTADPSDPDAVDVFYFPSVGADRPVLSAGTLAGAFRDKPEVWAIMEYFGTAEYANARQAAQRDAKGGEGSLSGFLSAAKDADHSLWTPLELSFLDILTTSETVRFDGSDLMPADVGAGTFWTEGTSFINGDVTAEEAAAAIDASWP